MAAMPREVKVKTLEGGVATVQAIPTSTIKELKAMLLEEKDCEDPIERQILKAKVLARGLLVDDDETLESAELLHAESEVTVIYCRNEVEAATAAAIHAEGRLQVNIPSSLTEIPARAFQDCKQVLTVAIPESVTVIGNRAFEGCTSLARINVPESVTAIGNSAFDGCISLASITVPESVMVMMVIGDYAFARCESLASITIPESVTCIGRGAFAGCIALASIAIPESVTVIGGAAFRNCKSLARITLPQSVTAIGNCAFENCSSLASITIPESVTSIGKGAFAGCISLASITIPESLRENGQYAFNDELQAIIQHVWLWLFVATVGTLLFKFESDSLGQCGFSDQFYIISNSRTKQKSEEAKNPEMRNRTPEISQLPNEIDFRRFFFGEIFRPSRLPKLAVRPWKQSDGKTRSFVAFLLVELLNRITCTPKKHKMPTPFQTKNRRGSKDLYITIWYAMMGVIQDFLLTF